MESGLFLVAFREGLRPFPVTYTHFRVQGRILNPLAALSDSLLVLVTCSALKFPGDTPFLEVRAHPVYSISCEYRHNLGCYEYRIQSTGFRRANPLPGIGKHAGFFR